jgi:hypothetical protein
VRFHFTSTSYIAALQPRPCQNMHGLGFSPFDRHY